MTDHCRTVANAYIGRIKACVADLAVRRHDLFLQGIPLAGTRYARQQAKARWARSFPQKEPVMTRIELYNHYADADPVTSFATDAEIEFADQLRHQLEERYLGRSAPSSPCSDEISPS